MSAGHSQPRPLHPPQTFTLRVNGRVFPGFPPDTITLDPHRDTFELSRNGVKLASGTLASHLHDSPRERAAG